MKIRQACPEDAAAIVRVRGLSWQAAYDGLLAQDVIATFTGPGSLNRQRAFFELPDRRALLAEADGEAIGFAAFGPDRNAADTDPPGTPRELYSLYVVPEHWSSGAGRLLMAAVMEALRDSGYDWVGLWVLESNARARRFYERAGFAWTGERKGRPELGDVPELHYERKL